MLSRRSCFIVNTFLIVIYALGMIEVVASEHSADLMQKYLGSVESKVLAKWEPSIEKNDRTVWPITRFVILPNGQVANIHISRSSNNPDLDSSAIQAVKASAPFPPITVAPYNKNGIPIEMDFDVDVFAMHTGDANVNKIIAKGRQKFGCGDWQSAVEVLKAGLAKYPNDLRLKSELSEIYVNEATLLLDKSPQSATGVELAKKALLLDPTNDAAKKLLPAQSAHL
jgi:TonB family protein